MLFSYNNSPEPGVNGLLSAGSDPVKSVERMKHMTFAEILKAKGLSDKDVESVIGEMKQNKIFTAGEENLDVRYGKLKTDYESLKTQHGESTAAQQHDEKHEKRYVRAGDTGESLIFHDVTKVNKRAIVSMRLVFFLRLYCLPALFCFTPSDTLSGSCFCGAHPCPARRRRAFLLRPDRLSDPPLQTLHRYFGRIRPAPRR